MIRLVIRPFIELVRYRSSFSLLVSSLISSLISSLVSSMVSSLILLTILMSASTPARAAATDSAASGGLMQITLSLLLVVGLLIGLSVLFKKFGLNRINQGAFPVKIIGAMTIGNNQRLMMIEVGDQWLLLGVTGQQITTLTTMPRQDSGTETGSPDKLNFSAWMQTALEKYHAKKP